MNTDVELFEEPDETLCKHVKNRLRKLSVQSKVQYMSTNNTGMCKHGVLTIIVISHYYVV